MQVLSSIDKRITSGGSIWAMVCGCFGLGWFGFPLVWRVDGFHQFKHYCPMCNKELAKYSPTPTARNIFSVVTIIIVILTLTGTIGFGIYYVVRQITRLVSEIKNDVKALILTIANVSKELKEHMNEIKEKTKERISLKSILPLTI